VVMRMGMGSSFRLGTLSASLPTMRQRPAARRE
jgi:hypothetical protein